MKTTSKTNPAGRTSPAMKQAMKMHAPPRVDSRGRVIEPRLYGPPRDEMAGQRDIFDALIEDQVPEAFE